MNKLIIPLIAIVALLGGFFLSSSLTHKEIEIQSATWFKQAMTIPEFELTDHNNQAFTNANLKQKWSVLFFGYTHCPDICPDSLNMLKIMLEKIDSSDRNNLQIVFISVDPDRDTPEKLKEYVTFFNKDFVGATTSLDKLKPLTKKLGILHYITKTETSYDVAHAGNMLLINPDGHYTAVFSPPHDADAMASDLQSILDYFE